MKVLLAFYSRTGNTERLVNKLRETLSDVHGVEIAVHRIIPPREYRLPYLNPKALKDALSEKGTPGVKPIDLGEYDLVVIASPIWFERPAPPVTAFIEEARGCEGKRAIAITTSVSARSVYAKRLADRLRKKGFEVVGWYSLKRGHLPEEVVEELKLLAGQSR